MQSGPLFKGRYFSSPQRHFQVGGSILAGLLAIFTVLFWPKDGGAAALSVRSLQFMPYGYCYMWNPSVLWLHVLSDGLIAGSYFSISFALVYLVRQRHDLPFNGFFWMFSFFIISCGFTHLMEIWTVWHASYICSGAIKAATALLSLATAGMIVPLLPKVIALPSAAQLLALNEALRAEGIARQRVVQELRATLIKRDATLSELGDRNATIAELQLAQELLREGAVAREQIMRELTEFKFALDQHACVTTTTVQGTITYVNERFSALSGYPKEELIGQNSRILNSGHHGREFFQEMHHSITNGKVWHGEFRNRARDGSHYWVDTTIVPFLDRQGKPRQYIAIGADITNLKRVLRMSQRLAAIVESSNDAIISKDLDGAITAWNHGAEIVFGYTEEEVAGKSIQMIIPTELAEEEFALRARMERGESIEHFETIRLRKGGQRIHVAATISPIRDDSNAIVGISDVARDITDRTLAEESLRTQANIIDLAHLMVRDTRGHILLWSLGSERLYGFTEQDAIGRISHQLLHTRFPQPLRQIEHTLEVTGAWEGELLHRKRDGSQVTVWSVWRLHRDLRSGAPSVLESNTDITELKRAEKRLEEQTAELAVSREALEVETTMLQSVLDSMSEGLVAVDQQGTIIICNGAAERVYGLGKTTLHAEDWSEHYGLFLDDSVTPFPHERMPLVRAIRGEESSTEMFVKNHLVPQGAWVEVLASPRKDKRGTICGGVAAFRDVTQAKADGGKIRHLNEQLAIKNQGLQRSNEELLQFAYVASHDLQEPLRMVASYVQLLARRYKGCLDSDADEFIAYAVEGCVRMKTLIHDLLAYSQAGEDIGALRDVSVEDALRVALTNLCITIEQNDALVTHEPLPSITTDEKQLTQVFQNLVGNAIKYRSTQAPHVHISAASNGTKEWLFAVRDNGLGIDPEYFQQIFVIFQRLHGRSEFDGTGIGLAICKKIIERMGGRIWVESQAGNGSTFYFTVPKGNKE
jgi:PAS domain S-box-containing protein